jgi:hypothetical protein
VKFASDFTLAAALTFRNLFIMRQLLFVLALLCAVSPGRAADGRALVTNAITLGEHGTLEALTPPGWTLIHTNLNLPYNPPTVELHSVSNTMILRLTIYWDGFEKKINRPTDADMDKIVSNAVVAQYLPISVERTINLEKLKGPSVAGTFVRFTDAGWTPVVKDEYPNLTTGMFRCESLWGNFDLLTFDKDGPLFQQGLKVLKSLRRKP